MQKVLLSLFTCLLFSLTAFAQRTAVWDGPEDGGDWNEAINWNMDLAPVTGDTVVFNSSAIVNGTSTGDPVQLRINGAGTTVTLNLDLTVGGSTTALNAVAVNAGSRLVLSGNTLNINPETSSNGLHIGSTADGASVNIQGSATVNITGGNHGINCANATANIVARGTLTISGSGGNGIRLTDGLIENRGVLTISGVSANGIDNAATFTNFRSSTTVLTIINAGSNGIKNKATGVFTNDKDIVITGGGITADCINTEGAFTNMDNSSITVSGANDDGIDVLAGAFNNDGTVTTTAKDGATNANNALSISGVFTNTSNNSLNADGGDVGRAVGIDATGSLLNTGTITLTGGDADNRINSSGDVTNDVNGTIDLTDGRINTSGTLTNNGLLISTRGAAGIFNTGTATNNAFFTYGGGNFASGSGTFDDLGIDLDKGSSWRIDVMNGCSVKIANVSYEYEEGSTSVGTSAADGTLTFDETTFSEANINIEPVGLNFPAGLKVRLQNATCNQALPIDLVSLEALSMPKSIMVKWATSSETGNDYIAVERSADGQNFLEIGRVTGSGTSDLTNDYELEDSRPVSGTNYYRLRQVDYDGTTAYSHIVNADFGGAAAGAMKVFPTIVAAGELLNVDLTEVTTTLLRVIDGNGRIVTTYPVATGSVVSLPLISLRPGMYFLTDESGTVTNRFIIR